MPSTSEVLQESTRLTQLLNNSLSLSEQAILKADSSVSYLSELHEELNSEIDLLNIVSELRSIQRALGQLQEISKNDSQFIELAISCGELRQETLNIYELRYGEGASRYLFDLKADAEQILIDNLRRMLALDYGEHRKQAAEIVSKLHKINASPLGDEIYNEMVLSNFNAELTKKSGSFQNIQFPYNAKLLTIYTLASDTLDWHSENFPDYLNVQKLICKEVCEMVIGVYDEFRTMILDNKDLLNLKLMDLASMEAVSMIRQGLAFAFVHMPPANQKLDFIDLYQCMMSTIERFTKSYCRLEKKYVQEVFELMMRHDENASFHIIEDSVGLFGKSIRRAMGCLDEVTLEALLVSFRNAISGFYEAKFKRPSDSKNQTNLSVFIELIEIEIEELEIEATKLRAEFWSSSKSSCVSLAAQFNELRRICDLMQTRNTYQ